ncbi:MAG: SusD/RagB family nutrient-binding outer membrane lipoprotein, partial [Bacteroidota bacterium]|nr:SusD/RagB family nutrient-binding outer membrane lipoprotein [Bacteroidota bacterium]
VGTGNSIFPLLTYPELCFYRAELAAMGITTENAAVQYENGVKASMKMYDQFGSLAKVFDYQAITDAEINAAYNHPKVKYDPAIGLQQIYAQSYIHFFKQANEAWSLFKRTGQPNSTTVLPLEQITADGVVQRMPRRALINVPLTTNMNYENAKRSLEQMASDPGFGQGPSDIFGRVWWDQQ